MSTSNMLDANTPFYKAVEAWVDHSLTRTRKPLRRGTVRKNLSYLNNNVLQGVFEIADMPISLLGEDYNRIVRNNCIAVWRERKLSSLTQDGILKAIKLVLESFYDDSGKRLYHIGWNRAFLDVPVVEAGDRPAFTKEQCKAITDEALYRARGKDCPDSSKRVFYVLYMLLAGLGLRISEALALDVDDIQNDGELIIVNKRISGNELGETKTPASNRTVDVNEDLAFIFELHRRQQIRKGYKHFLSQWNGRRMHYQMVESLSLYPILTILNIPHGRGVGAGFHSFRKYRSTHLERAQVPKSLIDFWLGWEQEKTMLNHYSHLIEDVNWRRMYALRAGTGF
jgi:integrase